MDRWQKNARKQAGEKGKRDQGNFIKQMGLSPLQTQIPGYVTGSH